MEKSNKVEERFWGGNPGNYVMVHLPVSNTLAYRKPIHLGGMARIMTGFRFPGWIRISLVQAGVMNIFCQAVSQVMGELDADRPCIGEALP